MSSCEFIWSGPTETARHEGFLEKTKKLRLGGGNIMSNGKKILLVANTGWYLYNFRLPLARRLRDDGFEVVLVSPEDTYVERLRAEGFETRELTKLSRRGMNPLAEVFAVLELLKLYHREKPRAVHHFTVKCVLYGTIAAKLAGIKSVVNAVTGLGHIFLGKRWVTRAVRPFVRWLYRKILKARRGLVVFQNPDDLETFVQANLVEPERTVLIRSSGVCVQQFCPRPSSPDRDASAVPVVLFAGRLLAEKGIYEFVEAARMVKCQRTVCFQVAGESDHGNPSSVPDATVESWRQEGVVDLLGQIDGMADVMAVADIVVLPSYREGTPRVLLEAAAMGKPLVATDVPGCREVVQDGYNGLLVPAQDAQALAAAISRLIEDKALIREMGQNGRRKIEEEFAVEKVVQSTIQAYEKLGIVA